MKSTVKIDYAGSGFGGTPVIKITRPIEAIELSEFEDEDVRDRLVNDFLHTPGMVERNTLFTARTYGSPGGNAKIDVTTIGAVDLSGQFYLFRHSILNRLVPYESIIRLNKAAHEVDGDKTIANQMPERGEVYFKIKEFFDYIYKLEWVKSE